jgi:hypothetical protein
VVHEGIIAARIDWEQQHKSRNKQERIVRILLL